MFAFLGLGIQEILVLVAVGLLTIGVPVVVIASALRLARRSGDPAGAAELRAELDRLRGEIKRLKSPHA